MPFLGPCIGPSATDSIDDGSRAECSVDLQPSICHGVSFCVHMIQCLSPGKQLVLSSEESDAPNQV